MTKNNRSDREIILSKIEKSNFETFDNISKNYNQTDKSKAVNIEDFCTRAKNNGFDVLIWQGSISKSKLNDYISKNKLSRRVHCDKLPIFGKLDNVAQDYNTNCDNKTNKDLQYNIFSYEENRKRKNVVQAGLQKIKLDYEVTLCHAEGGVLETGSIVVSSKTPSPILLLSTCLIFVVAKKNILNYYEDFITKKNLLSNRYFGLISGPSKTGDIEQTILTGAHGPVMSLVIVV